MLGWKLTGAVLGARFGEPGPNPDVLAVGSDGFAGGGGPPRAVQEKFEDLHGLNERAARSAPCAS